MLSPLVIYTERKSSGIMGVPSDQVTKEGYDLQFATNVLGECCFISCINVRTSY